MQGMDTKPTPQTAHACEFDALRAKMRRCVRQSRRRLLLGRRRPMAGIEVAYLALADWIALVAESEKSA